MFPKVVLITGAAHRIGAVCARRLHGQGCNLILHYHTSAAQALALCDELNQIRKDSAVVVQANLAELCHLDVLANAAQRFWGGIDVLVNNASRFYPGKVGEVSEAAWNDLINTNLKAPFFLAQALAPALAARQGCIVNISDIYAEKGLPDYPVYSIAKAGLQAMTRCLAKDLAPDVRVNALAPGAILWPERELDAGHENEILRRVALGRCGEAEDIAKALSFLIHDADYITGQILAVDGGRSLFV